MKIILLIICAFAIGYFINAAIEAFKNAPINEFEDETNEKE